MSAKFPAHERSAESSSFDPSTLRHPRLRLLARHVKEHPHAPITLAQAADLVGFNRTYFCQFFRRHVGVSFTAWLRHCRIERAKLLLCDEWLHITRVASEVGYCDLTTFERAFKSHEGVSPRQFRRSIKPTSVEAADR